MLVGGAAAWPLAARAQQAAMSSVGILNTVDAEAATAFRKGLRDMGRVEGRNSHLELRFTEQYDQLPALAAELVDRRVTVLAAIGGPAAFAAKSAGAIIPIVFSIGGDPVELGLVSSLNRPGGNITGITFFSSQLLQKQVGILRDLISEAAVFAFLVNPDNPRAQSDWRQVQSAARSLGLEFHVVNASKDAGLVAAFDELVRRKVRALIVQGDPFFARASARIAALAAQHALPTIRADREYAHAGGLLSYGASLPDAHHQAGVYAGRILNGERPPDLPVMQPTKFELVINLLTAKTLGLDVPLQLQQLADEVIE